MLNGTIVRPQGALRGKSDTRNIYTTDHSWSIYTLLALMQMFLILLLCHTNNTLRGV